MSFLLWGHQRSGTSYVLDIFQQHPQIDTINEPFSMHLDFFRLNESYWDKEDFDKQYLHKDLRKLNETVSFIKYFDVWLNEDLPYVKGFKETSLVEKYFWLQQAVHFDQTIILIRDFRAVIDSVLRWNMHKGWWNYKQRLIDFYGYNDIELKDDIEICAWLIKHRISYLSNIIKTTECLVIKLEDLVVFPEKILQEMMNYIHLNIHIQQLEFIRETARFTRDFPYSNYRTKEQVMYAWRTRLGKKNIKRIEEILFEELYKFGYL